MGLGTIMVLLSFLECFTHMVGEVEMKMGGTK